MLAPTLASPESAGMSKAALDRIETHLKSRYLESGRFPCTQLLVYRRGKVVHSAVQGFADVERKVPAQDDTIFRIYSMTKAITAVAFMMLVEEGKVALDEPVHKYIPEWKDLGVFVAGTAPNFMTRPPSRPMQIVDLLRHTSGLTYGLQQRSNVDAAYREDKIARHGAGKNTRRHDQGPLETSTGVLARRGLELLGFHRCARLPHRQDFGQALPPVSEGAHLRSAWHGRHRFPCAGGEGPSLRRLLFQQSARQDEALRRSGEEQLSRAADPLFRRRRLVLDRIGLSQLLPRAAQWRRAWRRKVARTEDA